MALAEDRMRAACALMTERDVPSGPDDAVARKLARLADLEAATSSLRHDLRGMLVPALLVADRLLAHADPKVVKAGETVVKAVKRAEERLAATRAPAQDQALGAAPRPRAPT